MKYPHLAAQFLDWRTVRIMSREQAALRFGVSMATYIRWEQGNAKPRTLAALSAIKRELGKSFSLVPQ